MPTTILMPALSPTMEKGKLAKWLKQEGDKVRSGDVIAEIETDKATMEVEAVDEGRLGKILVPEGTDDVAVNDPDRHDTGRGEDVSAIAHRRRKPRDRRQPMQSRRCQARRRREPQTAGAGAATRRARQRSECEATASGSSPRRWRAASRRRPASTSPRQGSGPNGRIVKVDVETAAGPQAPAALRRPDAGIAARQ